MNQKIIDDCDEFSNVHSLKFECATVICYCDDYKDEFQPISTNLPFQNITLLAHTHKRSWREGIKCVSVTAGEYLNVS
jgi:hypothetical protein